MHKLSKKEISNILKLAEGKTSISAKEYREAISGSASKKKEPVSRSKKYEFNFFIDKIEEGGYLFTLLGRHLRTNAINSLPLREKMAYKTAIKKAFNDRLLACRNLIPKEPYVFMELSPKAFNSHSRDDDANVATLKIIRDCIVNGGFVVDDKRKHLLQHRCEEVISKEWKIEIVAQAI
jgi:hypothetical protein